MLRSLVATLSTVAIHLQPYEGQYILCHWPVLSLLPIFSWHGIRQCLIKAVSNCSRRRNFIKNGRYFLLLIRIQNVCCQMSWIKTKFGSLKRQFSYFSFIFCILVIWTKSQVLIKLYTLGGIWQISPIFTFLDGH